MLLKKFAFLLLFTSFSVFSFSQSEFRYQYNLENGLPSSYLKQIIQLDSGELLITTDNGLALFDGYSFRSFTTTNGLPSNYVKYVLIDHTKKMWIGTDGGLAYTTFSTEHDQKFKKYNLDPSNPDVKALRLFEDSKNRIWVASDKGIYLIQNDKPLKMEFGKQVTFLSDYVRSFSFTEDKNGNVWITTLGDGIYVYQNSGSTLRELNLPGLPKVTRSIYKFSDTEFWVGTSMGLYSVAVNASAPEKSVSKLLSNSILFADAITKENETSFYFGTDGNGFYNYNPLENKVKRMDALSSDYIKDVFVDRQKNIWVASDDGLTLLPYTLFDNISTPQNLPKRYVSGSVEDKEGNLWISNYEGMYKREKSSNKVVKTPQILNGVFIKNLVYNPKTDLIYVFGRSDIYELNPATSQAQIIKSIPTSYEIESAYLDNQNALWLLTTTPEIFRLSLMDRSLDFYNKKNGISVPIKSASYGPDGNLWFGGANRTLLIYNNSTENFSPFDWKNQEVRPDSLATFDCLLLDSWNRLWIGGTDGVYQLGSDKKTVKIDAPGETKMDNLRFMTGSRFDIWIGTNRYLFQINLNEGGDISVIRGFNKKDGLLSTSFSYRSAFLHESGRFYMGSNLGLSFYTGSAFQEKLSPLKLNSWQSNDQNFYGTDEVELEPGNNTVTFNVVCINYPTDEILYQTRMIGLNDKWSTPSRNRFLNATLTNSGQYEMQARALTKGGLQTEILSVKFNIPPPIWLRWYFIMFYIVFVGGGIFLFITWRSKTLETKNRELESFVEQRTAEIMKRDQELKELIQQMDEKGSLLSKESISLNHNITTMTASSVQQSSAIAQTTATMEELAKSNEMIEHSAGKVAEMISHTQSIIYNVNTLAQQSTEFMTKVQSANEIQVQKIQDLSQKIENIKKISSFIENLNDQTQLIAFNAAIEATVAGDVGRRFKVIADEIRFLANDINSSTREINQTLNTMIDEISDVVKLSDKNRKGIEEGVRLNHEVSKAFETLNDAAVEASTATNNITISTSQQSSANDQMVTSLREIADSSNHLVEIIKDISKTSHQMESMANYFLKLKS